MATRDIKVSVLLTLLFVIMIKYFINDKSTFCIIQNLNNDNNITRDEYIKAQETIKKYEINKNLKK